MAGNLFKVEAGFNIDDEVFILHGADDPSVSGLEAPVGSLYLRKSAGTFFQKTGLGGNAWVEHKSGVSSSNGNMDGGNTSSVYLPNQIIDGEDA